MGVFVPYLRYVVRHKLFVYREAKRLGVPGRGLVHDNSKLYPDEFWPYAKWFYGGERRPWADVSGYEKTYFYETAWRESKEGAQQAFDLAWLRHQKRNDHHYQFWLLYEDDGDTKILEMPDGALREMVADWLGAGKAIAEVKKTPWSIEETHRWYRKTEPNRRLHPNTKTEVEGLLGLR